MPEFSADTKIPPFDELGFSGPYRVAPSQGSAKACMQKGLGDQAFITVYLYPPLENLEAPLSEFRTAEFVLYFESDECAHRFRFYSFNPDWNWKQKAEHAEKRSRRILELFSLN